MNYASTRARYVDDGMTYGLVHVGRPDIPTPIPISEALPVGETERVT